MQTALEELRKKKSAKPAPLPVPTPQEQPDCLEAFFAKPRLPDELLPFELMHRHAATGSLPDDKSAEIIAAIHAAADCKRRSGLMWEARIETLQELDEWFQAWLDAKLPTGEADPFADE